MSMERAEEMLAVLHADHGGTVSKFWRLECPLVVAMVLVGTTMAGYAAGALRDPALWGSGCLTMVLIAAVFYPRRPTLRDVQFDLHIDGLTESIRRRRVHLNRLERAEEARLAHERGKDF